MSSMTWFIPVNKLWIFSMKKRIKLFFKGFWDRRVSYISLWLRLRASLLAVALKEKIKQKGNTSLLSMSKSNCPCCSRGREAQNLHVRIFDHFDSNCIFFTSIYRRFQGVSSSFSKISKICFHNKHLLFGWIYIIVIILNYNKWHIFLTRQFFFKTLFEFWLPWTIVCFFWSCN